MPHILKYWERPDPAYLDGPGAETFTQFLDRARSAILRFAKMAPGGCVVVFTHGFMMQAIRLLLLFPHATDAELMRNFRRFHSNNFVANTEVAEFEVREGRIKLVGQLHLNDFTLLGETSHA
jgi:broad specificity phosphatase PhoE